MKFFVDTADVAAIRDLHATGLVDGVTTNPSLVGKSGRDFREVIVEICEVTDGPVSARGDRLRRRGCADVRNNVNVDSILNCVIIHAISVASIRLPSVIQYS